MARQIELNHICKIEGHASLSLKIEDNQLTKCFLEAEEGARFFEALVVGKNVSDVQEIVTRICGICSGAHSVAAIQALENALGLQKTEKESIVQELILIGERIRSHATHLYFLILPDYLGYGALTMAKNQKENIADALLLIRLGNTIVERLGGREMHPFMKFNSTIKELNDIIQRLNDARPVLERTISIFTKLSYPQFTRPLNYMTLRDEKKYAYCTGKIVSNIENMQVEDYTKHLKENIKEYATSKFVLFDDKPYLSGSSIRLNVNHDLLDANTLKLIKKYKISLPITNPFQNSMAQSVEISQSVERAIVLLEKLQNAKDSKAREVNLVKGRGVAAVEAPRGVLFHEYKINQEGKIEYCNIITPTAQNLNQIELDIRLYVNELLKKKTKQEDLVIAIEKLIRSYDPCFSCSTHFLKVNWE